MRKWGHTLTHTHVGKLDHMPQYIQKNRNASGLNYSEIKKPIEERTV